MLLTNEMFRTLKTIQAIFTCIVENNLIGAYPNIWIACRMYLSLMVSVCTGERSFSKLKLQKNALRNTTGQKRLVALMRISTSSDIVSEIKSSEIIKNFVGTKNRKRYIRVQENDTPINEQQSTSRKRNRMGKQRQIMDSSSSESDDD